MVATKHQHALQVSAALAVPPALLQTQLRASTHSSSSNDSCRFGSPGDEVIEKAVQIQILAATMLAGTIVWIFMMDGEVNQHPDISETLADTYIHTYIYINK